MESDQCITCKHYHMQAKCEAYPTGIPEKIFSGQFDHKNSFPGDGGIHWEPVLKETNLETIELLASALEVSTEDIISFTDDLVLFSEGDEVYFAEYRVDDEGVVEFFNPYHDRLGRFAPKGANTGGGGGGGVKPLDSVKDGWMAGGGPGSVGGVPHGSQTHISFPNSAEIHTIPHPSEAARLKFESGMESKGIRNMAKPPGGKQEPNEPSTLSRVGRSSVEMDGAKHVVSQTPNIHHYEAPANKTSMDIAQSAADRINHPGHQIPATVPATVSDTYTGAKLTFQDGRGTHEIKIHDNGNVPSGIQQLGGKKPDTFDPKKMDMVGYLTNSGQFAPKKSKFSKNDDITSLGEFTLSEKVEFAEDSVICTGKLFEAGDYPDKQFSITPQEMEQAVAKFTPVNNDLQHTPTILDGKLGRLESVYVQGKELFGKVRIPKWLHDLNPQGIKTSLTWTRGDKSICGNALVLNPRVQDAQVVAAFTAACDNTKQTNGGTKLMWLDKLKAMFTDGKLPEELKDFDPSKVKLAEEPDPEPKTEPKAQFSDEQLDAINANLIKNEAEKFCSEAVRDSKVFPAEIEKLKAMFTKAVQDDNEGKVCFSSQGTVNEGERVKTLREMIAARPKHNLTMEQLEGGVSEFTVLGSSGGDKKMTPERKEELIKAGGTIRPAKK